MAIQFIRLGRDKTIMDLDFHTVKYTLANALARGKRTSWGCCRGLPVAVAQVAVAQAG